VAVYPSATVTLSAGQRLGAYEVGALLGKGGMGEVYRACDTRLRREVALKVLPAALAEQRERLARFEHEARVLAALSHPGIATIYGLEESGGTPVLVLELVEGQSLNERVAHGGLGLREALDIASQIAAALQAAHEKGIIHRDLKPSNVQLTQDGKVKLLDFGLAKALSLEDVDTDPEAPTLARTEAGTALGTPAYMSPEQARGEPVDRQTDLWSFGCVLYEMLTGHRAFDGRTTATVIAAILEREPDLGALPHATPEPVRHLLRRLLSKDRAHRLRDIADARLEIEEALRGEPGGRTRSKLADRVRIRSAFGSSRRLLGVVAVLVLVAFAGWQLVRRLRLLVPAEAGPKRIVVLPFQNLGPPDQEYFAGGLTEEVTSRLASLNGLAVISRNSAFQYAKAGKTTKQIGQELRVDYILEGSVRWEPGQGRARVSQQLIRVSDDTYVWSERYDRGAHEIFAVQSEIAVEVAAQLDLTLLAPERRALERRPTQNLEAYEVYLRAVHQDSVPGRTSELRTRELIALLERAVALDPRFALARARLSMAYSNLHRAGYERSGASLAKAKAAVDRSLEFQPDLPWAHLALGVYHYTRADYPRALTEFGLARTGMPSESTLFLYSGGTLRRQGRVVEALADMQRGAALDPRSAELPRECGLTSMLLRRYPEAIAQFDVSIALEPQQAVAFVNRAIAQWLSGAPLEQSRATLERARGASELALNEAWLEQERLERRHESAIARIAAMPFESIAHQFTFAPRALLLAESRRFLGQTGAARAGFDQARILLEQELASQADDARLHSALGIAFAGLGWRQDAVREARRGVELMPASKDALVSPHRTLDLARVYTMVDEADAALLQIESLLSTPCNFSVKLLEIDPWWDPLRKHARYRALVARFG